MNSVDLGNPAGLPHAKCSPPGRVYVVLLNWRGWRDTIECLESLFRSDYADFRVVVCDNGSNDGSLEKIAQWAAGELASNCSSDPALARLCSPPIEKPIELVSYGRDSAERGGDSARDARLVLIDNASNLGFAGGNNVGIRYSLARGDCSYLWLLNNDTVVSPSALRELVDRMEVDHSIGICGSRLIYYTGGMIQALGGASYNSWLGTQRNLGMLSDPGAQVDQKLVELELDYVVGASMLVSRAFLEQVGLLEEGYFLFYEEVDWARRANGRFRLGYAHESIVYHKEGASAGSSGVASLRSPLADYYLVRSRLAFTRRFHPVRLPTVMLGVLGAVLNRIRRHQIANALSILKALLGMRFRPIQASTN